MNQTVKKSQKSEIRYKMFVELKKKESKNAHNSC